MTRSFTSKVRLITRVDAVRCMLASTLPCALQRALSRFVRCALLTVFCWNAVACDLPADPATTETKHQEKGQEKVHEKAHEKAHEKDHEKDHEKNHNKNDEEPSRQEPSRQDSDASNASTNPTTDPGVVWYVTLHDVGARDPVTGQESVFGFGSDGTAAGGVLAKVPDAEGALQDLRGMLPLGDGTLLVISAWKHNTQILRFGAPNADSRRPFLEVFARSGDDNQLMVHPYAMALAPDGSILVSNQDSNTVTRYGAPGSSTAGKPLGRDGQPETGVKTAGLVVPSREMENHGVKEVRGIAFSPDGTLLVADRGKGEVTRWNITTGERLGVLASKADGIETPIQLLLAPDGDTLYISDNKRDEVFRLDLTGGKPTVFIGADAGIDATSSIAIHDGFLYVGSRKAREILRFRLSDGAPDAKPFIANLPDNPEFFIANPPESKP